MDTRENLRKEFIQESASAPELLQTAGELPSCRECGGIPYLSYVPLPLPVCCPCCILVSILTLILTANPILTLYLAEILTRRLLFLLGFFQALISVYTPGHRWGELRCLQHSHIGCMCPWPCKVLYLRVTDRQLTEARLTLRELCNRVRICC